MTFEEKATLEGHSNWVECVAWSPGGETLVSGSRDTLVKLWDVITFEEKLTLEGHNNWVTSVAWNPKWSNHRQRIER